MQTNTGNRWLLFFRCHSFCLVWGVYVCVCVSYSQGHACVHTCAWRRRGQISMLGVFFCCQPYYLETASLVNLEAFRFDWLAGNQLEFACLCCPVLELQTHPAVSGISHEWWGFEFSPCACGARALIHWAISWASHLVWGGLHFSWAWSLESRLIWMARQPQGPPCLHCPSAGVTSVCLTCLDIFFDTSSGNWTQVFIFV